MDRQTPYSSFGDRRLMSRRDWVLFTNLEVKSYQQALHIVQCYVKRWTVEQFFRLKKTKGFQAETLQFYQTEGLKNYIAFLLIAAVRVFQMVNGRDNQQRAANRVFHQDELAVLENLNSELEGNTDKSKNPYQEKSLAWGCWIVA
jgi:hypothetical protein